MSNSYAFIDLCAGIGGGRLGLTKEGFNCKGFSEIDKKAIKTYKTFYGEELFLDDLTLLKKKDVPKADILIAGFPCQTFSIVGKRKGFEDNRGKIIFSIAKILKDKKIPYFILENVKGLKSVNNGKELKNIESLLSDTGYNVYHKVLNSYNFGVPQSRERIYFVGIKKELDNFDFEFPKGKSEPEYDLSKYLVSKEKKYILDRNNKTFLKYLENKYNKGKYNIEEILKQDYLILDTRQSDLRLYENKVPTIRRGRQGILYVRDGQLRKLSGKEALFLQGFCKKIVNKSDDISDSDLLKQAGNAMTVGVIENIAKNLKKVIK